VATCGADKSVRIWNYLDKISTLNPKPQTLNLDKVRVLKVPFMVAFYHILLVFYHVMVVFYHILVGLYHILVVFFHILVVFCPIMVVFYQILVVSHHILVVFCQIHYGNFLSHFVDHTFLS
jgi:hypothetical protein